LTRLGMCQPVRRAKSAGDRQCPAICSERPALTDEPSYRPVFLRSRDYIGESLREQQPSPGCRAVTARIYVNG
jgi:hypothetical protein